MAAGLALIGFVSSGYNARVKQARQSLAIERWREEGPDSTEQGDG